MTRIVGSHEAIVTLPITPMTKDWFSTITFGDSVKIASVFALAVTGYVKLGERVDHESELRRMLEGKTLELVAQLRVTQIENTARYDAKFKENSDRDREVITEIKQGLNRLNDKVDNINNNQRALASSIENQKVK